MHRAKKNKKWLICLFLVLIFAIIAAFLQTESGSGDNVSSSSAVSQTGSANVSIEEGQSYSTKDEVAAYIHEFSKLPPNYITKEEAQTLGWDSSQGNLWEVTDKKSIGGDRFSNREGSLPKAYGRQYYECDINYNGGYRGAERLVYSDDGLVFYTSDHYETFSRLY